MFDSTTIAIVQIVISVALVAAILLQKGGEEGLGGAFGGGSGSSYYTKRGLEKGLFIATIVLGILFAASAIVALLIR